MALLTGDIASELSAPPELVVEKHETFATLTTIIFGFLTAAYVVYGIQLTTWHGVIVRSPVGKIWGIVSRIALLCVSPIVAIPLALVGLIAVTITGALGGLMVYGPKVDPFVGWVAKIFFPNGF